ncbi:hypothetical protein HPB47_023884 [Ixodes persulcatus]|uniref:Uncharacterized protein n=1 Tax=Ixodes persulcatus TaxID=34615 RepID=A0AC60Q6C1_IXOPE|nr:hypothetical protein HPB47_023884 [Ixodes persulcatus]
MSASTVGPTGGPLGHPTWVALVVPMVVYLGSPTSYMQKLHKDLQLSSPEFKALHFKDPCHLLNNVLNDGLKTDSFVVVHDFVVHFPALLKSSRELRRKFGLVCTSMGMKIKCLSTVVAVRSRYLGCLV